MDWIRLAEKDVRDARRDWTLHWVLGGFALLGAFITASWGILTGTVESSVVPILTVISLFAIPTIILIVSHERLSGERASGRIRTTMALPYTRRDLLLGAFIGRSIIGITTVVVFTLAAVGAGLLVGVPTPIVELGAFGVATSGLAIAFVALGIGWSAVTPSTTHSLIGCLFTYVAALFWPIVLGYAWEILVGGTEPKWLDRVGAMDPLRAYLDAAEASAGGAITSTGTAGSIALGFGLLLFWTILPLVIGDRRFRTADL